MNWRVVARGRTPSGEAVVHLCSRTGLPASDVREGLVSPGGLVIREDLEREPADSLSASLSFDGITIEVVPSTGPGTNPSGFRVVLTGYVPGSRGRLRAALMRMSRKSDEEVIGFLARIPFALRRNADPETAASVRRMIEAAGGVVEIRPEGREPSKPSPPVDEKPAPRFVGIEAEPLPQEITDKPPVQRQRPQPPPVNSRLPRLLIREPHTFTTEPPDTRMIDPPRALRNRKETFNPPERIVFAAPSMISPLPHRLGSLESRKPPATCSQRLFPVFLCPVQESSVRSTVAILEEKLGFSGEIAMQIVRRAPSAIALEKSHQKASERVRELSGKGLPVSLVRQQGVSAKQEDHVWFGNWIRTR